MDETKAHRIQLLEGNRTVRRLMEQALTASGFAIFEDDEESLADLLIVDVDSGLDGTEEQRERYMGAGRAVLVCGLRASRERFSDGPWLERPFSAEGLLAECRGVLELDDPNSIVLFDDLEDFEAPGDADATDEGVEGGALVGCVKREPVEVRELEWSESVDPAPPELRSDTLNQTMPDAPAAMAPREVEQDSNPRFGEDAPSSAETMSPKWARELEDAAQLLADAWGRIGLAARTRDRANYIQGILRSVFSQGATAASAELERIPGEAGFSGDLTALGLEDLLYMVWKRGLRGRLEISVGDDDFVLYLDGGSLVDLENLSGSDDQLLLDILLDLGAIAHQVYDEVSRTVTDELAPPVQMQLRHDHLVSIDDLRQAREELVRRLCRQLLVSTGGSFAFMPNAEESGQAWPVDSLAIPIEDVLDAVGAESGVEQRSANGGAELAASAAGAVTNEEIFVPEGLEVDDQLPKTVEVPGYDSDM